MSLPRSHQDDQESLLRLWLTPGLGPQRLQKLIEQVNPLKDIQGFSLSAWQQLGLSATLYHAWQAISWEAVARHLQWAQHPEHHLLTWLDPAYPPLLREIAAPPMVLTVIGQPHWLLERQFAVIGSRRPSHQGLENAWQYAHALAEQGFIITSGLAKGIDTAAHHGALAAHQATIAVLGNGLATVYPAANRRLAKRIGEQGALLSEFPLTAGPKAQHFPQRNRLISGLSQGILVVEAALNSGSLSTARHALEQNRDIFAIPGSIRNPLTKGSHHLLKQGAKLVENLADILQELPSVNEPSTPPPVSCTLDPGDQKLVSCIDFEMTTVETISKRSGMAPQHCAPRLVRLELHGLITTVFGGYCRLR